MFPPEKISNILKKYYVGDAEKIINHILIIKIMDFIVL